MKRKLTMLLALVLIAAMLSTSVMAGGSGLIYSRAYSWDNGYLMTKATEHWYGNEEGSTEAKAITVYEYTYGEYGQVTVETITTEDKVTKEVTKEIIKYFYDENVNLTKVVYSEIAPGETEETVQYTAIYEYDDKGREVKAVEYEGTEQDSIFYTRVTEYHGDVWRPAKETLYSGPEKEENLDWVYTYKYNDKEQMIEYKEVDYSGDEPVETITTYEYDEDGNRIKEACGAEVYSYTYNDNGLCVKEIYTYNGVEASTSTYEYDENDNCVKELRTYAEGDPDKFEYTYDHWDNILTERYNDELRMQNTYLINGKIKERNDLHWGETYSYTYDSNGNNTGLKLTLTDPETEKSFVSATVTMEYSADETMNPFADVEVGAWYYAPVVWAYYNGVTTGVNDSDFAPTATCTRAEVVTFLYRAAGTPAVSDTECPFEDVELDTWYSDAVLWAVENGITTGKDATHFDPTGIVSRAEFVTFLYRAAEAEKSEGENTFPDVVEGEWYYDAVLWAAENGITTGKTDGTFAPAANCSRAETVTFLFRYYG